MLLDLLMIIRPGLSVLRQAFSLTDVSQAKAPVEVEDQWRSGLRLPDGINSQDSGIIPTSNNKQITIEESGLSAWAFNILKKTGLLTVEKILQSIQENNGNLPKGTVENSSKTGREIINYALTKNAEQEGETSIEESGLSTRALKILTTEGLLTVEKILQSIQENNGNLPEGTVKNSSDTGREIIHYALTKNAEQEGETSITDTELGLEIQYFSVLLRSGLFTAEDVLEAIQENNGALPYGTLENSSQTGRKIINFALNINAKKKDKTSITELNLDIRYINALLKKGLFTVEDAFKALSQKQTICRDQGVIKVAVLGFWARQSEQAKLLPTGLKAKEAD